MPRISKPTDSLRERISDNTPLSWGDFVSDIIKGKYVLLVGSEVMLKKEYGDGDSHRDILDSIVIDLKRDNTLGQNFQCESFTELVRKTHRSDIRQLIIESLIGEDCNYQCTTDAVSEELKNLLNTKFFRIVMTTTFDEYLENVMREIWGNELRVMSIYDDGRGFDFDEREQGAEEFDIRPTLYYICGKVNTKGCKFAVTESDAIDVVAKWLSGNSPYNFLKNLRNKGLVSLGCKFDDWLFRFIWYILRKDINSIDSRLKDAVAVSFLSEYGKKLNDYLQSKNVYTESDARGFIKKILNHKEQCVRNIASANSQLGGIFVSYAHEDMPIAANIVERLRKEGFNIWFDSAKLESGDSYDARITQAISHCKIFIPILSPQVKIDLKEGNLCRYYMSVEWAQAIQLRNINGDAINIMPLAVNGYNERESYHRKTPFGDISVANLMQTPIVRFIEEIKKRIKY